MHVTLIYGDVHPYFSQDSRRTSQPDPIEEKLRQMRDQKVSAIANTEGAVLLYFASTFNERELNQARRGQIEKLKPAQEAELATITLYESQLGGRIAVIPAINEETISQRVLREFEKRGWQTTSESHIYAFGEMYGACVKAWAEKIGTALGIPDERRHLVKELSMTQEHVVRMGERRL